MKNMREQKGCLSVKASFRPPSLDCLVIEMFLIIFKHNLHHFSQKFLNKVQEVFLCICCQEVVYQPITTECQHNVCRVRSRTTQTLEW